MELPPEANSERVTNRRKEGKGKPAGRGTRIATGTFRPRDGCRETHGRRAFQRQVPPRWEARERSGADHDAHVMDCSSLRAESPYLT